MIDLLGGGEPQAGNKQNNNSMAERALLRVNQKLNGVEEECALSVEGQVNLLIQQARDPKRLSGLFNRWMATEYLIHNLPLHFR